MPATAQTAIAVVGIDIGKNSFHIVGLDDGGAIVLRQKWSRGQVEARLPTCAVPGRHGGLRRRASSHSAVGSKRLVTMPG
jgi:hypothetical protein